MTAERAYRQDGLTIGTLAQQLGLPEYRLRRLINQALGYRNFNSFVNHYRIAEVKAALADPSQAEVPVLTIALDAGFSSLGPFNRAFKAETGMTPSEYRRLQAGKAAADRNRPADFNFDQPDFELGEKQSGGPLGSPDVPAIAGRIRQGEPFMHRSISLAAAGHRASSCCRAAASLDRAPDVAAGFVSHQLCSADLRLPGRARAVLSRVHRPHPVAARRPVRPRGRSRARGR